MKIPMANHQRVVEITLSHTYAEDAEFETVDCPGSNQPVDVNPIAFVLETECPECGLTIQDLADRDLL